MKDDPKMSFSKLKTNDPYYNYPLAENMTRRLKKMAQLICRVDGSYDFECQIKTGESSGFSTDEKKAIIEVLGDYGIPHVQDDINKPDYLLIRAKSQNLLQRPLN